MNLWRCILIEVLLTLGWILTVGGQEVAVDETKKLVEVLNIPNIQIAHEVREVVKDEEWESKISDSLGEQAQLIDQLKTSLGVTGLSKGKKGKSEGEDNFDALNTLGELHEGETETKKTQMVEKQQDSMQKESKVRSPSNIESHSSSIIIY